MTPFLEPLFNACLRQNTFPDGFKLAKVIPLFKGGDKSSLECYRPISLLPAFSKILEKIIQAQTLNHFIKHKVISEQQFGFRPKFTTEYAILDIYEKLIHNLDNKLTSSIYGHGRGREMRKAAKEPNKYNQELIK